MKILISIGTLGLGGAEKQAVWLANKLAEEHQVTLLTYHGGAREKDLSSRVTWRTIFDLENEIEIPVLSFMENLARESLVSQDLTTPDRYFENNVTTNEFDLNHGASRYRKYKDRVKNLLKGSPAMLNYLIRIHHRFGLFGKLLKIALITVIKVARKSKQLLVRIVKFLVNLLNSVKSRVSKFIRKIAYSLTFPKMRLILKNQTYVFRKARKEMKKFSPDLIITFLFHDTLNVGLAGLSQIKRPRLIVGRRSPIGYGDRTRSLIHRLVLRLIYSFANLAVSNSMGNLESARRDGLRDRKIRVIGNYITQSKLSEISFTKEKPLRILCIANFHWYKNHEGLLRAVSSIPGHDQTFNFTFVGDGPLLEDMQMLAAELNISAEFKGFVDNPASEIHLYHAITLVSHIEGSSNALLEGLATGVPALVSRVGASQELFSQGAPIVLCNANDIQSIADGLIQLRDNYKILQNQARNFAEVIGQTLSEESVLRQWQQAIHDVTSS
jgi:L-malate glycosyltransferase